MEAKVIALVPEVKGAASKFLGLTPKATCELIKRNFSKTLDELYAAGFVSGQIGAWPDDLAQSIFEQVETALHMGMFKTKTAADLLDTPHDFYLAIGKHQRYRAWCGTVMREDRQSSLMDLARAKAAQILSMETHSHGVLSAQADIVARVLGGGPSRRQKRPREEDPIPIRRTMKPSVPMPLMNPDDLDLT